ncbi:kinase-like domain-containing protein [Mycena maculata]|uniref:Casein kinase II subunit alpha n=1 Tax=Mycena maculata TaxID=230809 RepID=A0AAD7JRR9_9AGAR|nr:kinase-like domain-containing protein [Mycena maculata]
MHMSRVHADANAILGKSWYDYDNFQIDWSPPERYEIVRRLGGGKYSEVFEGIDMVNSDRCVIKVLKPVAAKKIKREIKVLRNLTGGPNVISLLDVVRDPSGRYHSLVMEYVENVDWKRLFPVLTEADVKHYTFQLLLALSHTHAHGVMHRDIKPANVMLDFQRRELRLIDWGLAEFYHPNVDYHIRVGSRYYKAPELLVGYKRYDYSLDMWSVGCMFASMIFRKEHFFRGSDNDDQLLKVMKTLGTERFDLYLKTYNIHFETEIDNLLVNYPKQPWTRFITAENRHLASAPALDFLDKLLRYDHRERLTATEASAHPYFNSVRLETILIKEDPVSDSGFAST